MSSSSYSTLELKLFLTTLVIVVIHAYIHYWNETNCTHDIFTHRSCDAHVLDTIFHTLQGVYNIFTVLRRKIQHPTLVSFNVFMNAQAILYFLPILFTPEYESFNGISDYEEIYNVWGRAVAIYTATGFFFTAIDDIRIRTFVNSLVCVIGLYTLHSKNPYWGHLFLTELIMFMSVHFIFVANICNFKLSEPDFENNVTQDMVYINIKLEQDEIDI